MAHGTLTDDTESSAWPQRPSRAAVVAITRPTDIRSKQNRNQQIKWHDQRRNVYHVWTLLAATKTRTLRIIIFIYLYNDTTVTKMSPKNGKRNGGVDTFILLLLAPTFEKTWKILFQKMEGGFFCCFLKSRRPKIYTYQSALERLVLLCGFVGRRARTWPHRCRRMDVGIHQH